VFFSYNIAGGVRFPPPPPTSTYRTFSLRFRAHPGLPAQHAYIPLSCGHLRAHRPSANRRKVGLETPGEAKFGPKIGPQAFSFSVFSGLQAFSPTFQVAERCDLRTGKICRVRFRRGVENETGVEIGNGIQRLEKTFDPRAAPE